MNTIQISCTCLKSSYMRLFEKSTRIAKNTDIGIRCISLHLMEVLNKSYNITECCTEPALSQFSARIQIIPMGIGND